MKKKKVGKFLTSLFILASLYAYGQDSLTHQIHKKRLATLSSIVGVGYSATLLGLNELWYKDFPREPFHFFNDNKEWKQVDKLGHFYSAFYLSQLGSAGYRWCNFSDRKAYLLGAVTGFLLLLPIEIFDGFSSAYGASPGDLVANASGAMLFYGQKTLWNEIRLFPKFSFQQTKYPSLRPSVLGDRYATELLKDYNGQTYWLSLDIDKFLPMPKWLNLAIGYGANGMIYARDEVNVQAGYHPYREYYVSLDPDLSFLQPRSKALKFVLQVISLIKIPSPTISFSKEGTHLHLLF